jgi:TolB protein
MRRIAAPIAAVLWLVGAAPAAATPPGTNGRIFFSGPPSLVISKGCGVASVRVNGTGYNCADLFGNDPAISPDRRRITGTRGDEPTEIYSSDINGRGIRRLTNAAGSRPNSSSPSFSPDSRRILFNKHGSGPEVDGVYVMNANGSGQRRLAEGGVNPVFSPSGAEIAYTRGGIVIANADGGGSRVIVPDRNVTTQQPLGRYFETNGEAGWAPNGRQLVFSRHTSTISFSCTPIPDCARPVLTDELYVVNADGTGLRQLTSTPNVQDLDASWSPDGRMIAYFRRPDGADDAHGEIWVMNADGTGQRRIALGANPEWSTVQGGPGKPRVIVRFLRLNRRRSCLGPLDGWSIRVLTTGLRFTRFTITTYVDRRMIDQVHNARSEGGGADASIRRGRHRLRVVVTDPAVNDRVSRTLTFRKC